MFPDKPGSGAESSRVSVSDDDERLKLASDLSDISDAEDSRVNMREHCAHRLFSPDARTDLIVDKTLSPDTYTSSSSVVSPSYPCKSGSAVKGELKTDLHNKDRTVQVQLPPPVPAAKPKIWSISEIISSNS